MPSGINLVTTAVELAVCATLVVFVIIRLVCARLHLRASRGSPDLIHMERGIGGLEPAVVASFPTQRFGNWLPLSGKDTVCAVCLAEYQDKDMLLLLPYCEHAFHASCIDTWLKQHSTCPICRVSLRNSPSHRKQAMRPLHSQAIRPAYSLQPLDFSSCQYGFPERYCGVADHHGMTSTKENVSTSSGNAC